MSDQSRKPLLCKQEMEAFRRVLANKELKEELAPYNDSIKGLEVSPEVYWGLLAAFELGSLHYAIGYIYGVRILGLNNDTYQQLLKLAHERIQNDPPDFHLDTWEVDDPSKIVTIETKTSDFVKDVKRCLKSEYSTENGEEDIEDMLTLICHVYPYEKKDILKEKGNIFVNQIKGFLRVSVFDGTLTSKGYNEIAALVRNHYTACTVDSESEHQCSNALTQINVLFDIAYELSKQCPESEKYQLWSLGHNWALDFLEYAYENEEDAQ